MGSLLLAALRASSLPLPAPRLPAAHLVGERGGQLQGMAPRHALPAALLLLPLAEQTAALPPSNRATAAVASGAAAGRLRGGGHALGAGERLKPRAELEDDGTVWLPPHRAHVPGGGKGTGGDGKAARHAVAAAAVAPRPVAAAVHGAGCWAAGRRLPRPPGRPPALPPCQRLGLLLLRQLLPLLLSTWRQHWGTLGRRADQPALPPLPRCRC